MAVSMGLKFCVVRSSGNCFSWVSEHLADLLGVRSSITIEVISSVLGENPCAFQDLTAFNQFVVVIILSGTPDLTFQPLDNAQILRLHTF